MTKPLTADGSTPIKCEQTEKIKTEEPISTFYIKTEVCLWYFFSNFN